MSAELPPVSDAGEPKTEPQPVEARPGAWKSGPLVGLLFGLLGGLLAWAVIQTAYPFFVLSEEVIGDRMTIPDSIERPIDRNNTLAALAVLGAASAVALSVGEGLCRRSWSTAIVGGAVCAVLVAGVGCLAGYLGFIGLEHYETRADLTELVKTIRVQSGMLAALGGGLGLVLGALLARRVLSAILCLVAGLLAGALAGMAYPMICATLIPEVVTKVVVPIGAQERLLWTCLFAGLMGMAIPANARTRARKRREPSPQETCDTAPGG